MIHWTRMFYSSLTVLLLAALGTGCQSTSGKGTALLQEGPLLTPTSLPLAKPETVTPAAHKGATLAPKMEVEWHITSGQKQPIPVMSGRSVIGPDGSMVIGPYGQFHVGGMTLAKAKVLIERELTTHVVGPKVQLQLVSPVTHATTWLSTTPAESGVSPSGQTANYIAPNWDGATTAPLPVPSSATRTSKIRFTPWVNRLLGQR